LKNSSAKKKIVVLGSTGSIGQSTMSVVRDLSDSLKIVGLAACSSISAIKDQIDEFGPAAVALEQETSADELREQIGDGIAVFGGSEGILEIARMPGADAAVCAIVGAAGLLPAIEAIRSGKEIALANKEVLVMAGGIVMEMARSRGVRIMPVDSEHSALFQCLEGEDGKKIKRLILTASGGPFRDWDFADFDGITPEQALNHPKWDMGSKVSIDSATMMNKGLEIIEAMWLFGVDIDDVDVVIHPQSIVHSMVEFEDGAIMAQMSEPDMRLPIQYALTYPERMKRKIGPFDFTKNKELTFEQPDHDKFPCLELARQAGRIGGTMPVVLNAANEMAVRQFLNNEIKFTDIPRLIEQAMQAHDVIHDAGVETLIEIDAKIRKECLV
jgi:1-deoxy-D-xylulose-5-phosphate reductoisomerase